MNMRPAGRAVLPLPTLIMLLPFVTSAGDDDAFPLRIAPLLLLPLAGVKLGYSLMDDLEATARYRDHPVHREYPDFRSHEQFSSPHHYSAMFTIKYLCGG